MTGDLIDSPFVRKYLPPAAAVLFVVLFMSLSMWQLDRAAEKKALLQMFSDDAPYSRPANFNSLGEFDRIQVDGQFLNDRQVLIDNILVNSRVGYYVITPFKPAANHPLLLVNRGWLPKESAGSQLPAIDVDDSTRTVRGLVGHLPRVGIRPGEAFEGSRDWPRVAVYPNLEEISTQLGEQLLPTLLLMSPDDEGGFVRQWQPNVSGPMTHYGYAFQWFAMAVGVVAIIFWHLRKGLRRGSTTE